MTYEIINKSDFQVGATLVTRIAEDSIDKKAFYTILESLPTFLLPFRHRSIDGQIEFTYEIGKNTKLAYLSGNFSPKDYAQLWTSVLRPMLDCDDWFLDPFSFVFHSDYLYFDKEEKQVKYLYIPSRTQMSNIDSLKDMVDNLAEQITVSDANLENKVLRAIKKDFNPKELLDILRPYQTASVVSGNVAPQASGAYIPQPIQPVTPHAAPHIPQPQSVAQPISPVPQPAPSQSDVPDVPPPSATPMRNDDIVINLQPGGKASKNSKKEEKESKRLAKEEEKNSKKEAKQKKVKEPKVKESKIKSKDVAKVKPEKDKKGLFGGKKEKESSGILMGAAAEAQPHVPPPAQPVAYQPAPAPVMYAPPEVDSATELDEGVMLESCGLRLVSHLNLPKMIGINIDVGRNFSIGRFDAVIGSKQSDFEFDKNTKAISRRHAVIERAADGYYIVDIGSSAGTFVNNERIVPNAMYRISDGDRVSFGNAGADYVWEDV